MRRRFVLVPALPLTLAACFPGGIVIPVPVSHYDRPAITGILLHEDQPVADRQLKAVAFFDRWPPSCEGNGAHAVTDASGRFELEADKDLITLWWGQDYNGVAICLPDSASGAVWSTTFIRGELPPFLPPRIHVTCILDDADAHVCVLNDSEPDANRE